MSKDAMTLGYIKKHRQELVERIDALTSTLHAILIEGDLNGEQFHEACATATEAVITKARITSLGETK